MRKGLASLIGLAIVVLAAYWIYQAFAQNKGPLAKLKGAVAGSGGQFSKVNARATAADGQGRGVLPGPQWVGFLENSKGERFLWGGLGTLVSIADVPAPASADAGLTFRDPSFGSTTFNLPGGAN